MRLLGYATPAQRRVNIYYRASAGPPADKLETAPLLLTVPEACASLRVSRWTFYRLVQQRRLATVRIGNRRLVTAAALAELVERLGESEAASL